MGSLRGKHIPDDFDPFWEENIKDQEIYESFYHCGYEDGYKDFCAKNDLESLNKAKEYIEQLESLIAANYRVMKEDIRKEYEK